MIRTIFLDAAGTLIEPAESVAAVYARHFAAVGWDVEERAVKPAFRTVFATLPAPDYASAPEGDRAERNWWRSVVWETARHSGIHFQEESFEAIFRDLFAYYDRGLAWSVFPEVEECLTKWRQKGMKLVVVSNFDRRLHRILADLGLSGFFDTIITSADARARKPDPVIFRHALAAAAAVAGETVHIGDHPVADGEGAAALGIRSFVLDRPQTSLTDAFEWLEAKI
ncbi:MAG: HAD-IA family hydrolase [Luteolibacter sp.]